MNRDISPGVMDLMNSFLRRTGSIGWLEWLPLGEIAAESPEQLVSGFNSLQTGKQNDLLMRLHADDSGPVADLIMTTLAQRALEISDEQVRDFVLEDGSQSLARTTRRLQRLEAMSIPLRTQVQRAEERLRKGFELAGEILSLEERRGELLADECGKEEEFATVHSLEREIVRLETRRRVLESYDLSERTSYRDELELKIATGACQKDDLEKEIAQLICNCDASLQQLASLTQERDRLGDEKRKGALLQEEMRGAIQDLSKNLKASEDDTARLRNEHAMLLAESVRFEELNREATLLVQQSRDRLEELRRNAEEAGHDQLIVKIREVFSLLPPDQADMACI